MPWVRFDDQYPIHRKVSGLSDAGFRLHTEAIFWCARNLTDGFISVEDLSTVAPAIRARARLVATFVRRNLWHESVTTCDSDHCPASVNSGYPQGWVIHDYWDYQPSKEQVKRSRESNAQRQQRWREAHGNGGSNGVTNGVSNSAPARPVLSSGSVVTDPVREPVDNRQSPPNLNGQSTPAARHPSARTVAQAIADATPDAP